MKIPRLFIDPIAGYDPWRDADGFSFDLKAAKRAIHFYERHLRHVSGELAGKAFRLERWQKQIVGHTFGWKRPDGTRRYRKVFLYIPRKNGKTTFGAGLVLICLYVDKEPGAQVYSAAADRNQAALVYEQAQGMVLSDPVLAEMSRVYRSFKAIEVAETGSVYRVISAEANTKHGYNSHCYCVDEVHAQRDAELMEVLETGTGARRQPLGIYLTTADFARPSPCNEMLDYAEHVRDGVVSDPTFLPIIYKASLEDDWTTEAVWKKANPCYGVSLKPGYMKEMCQKAITTPSFENTFKRLHLNIQTEQEKRWLPMEDWRACPVDASEDLREQECYAGLDLSTTTDITAMALWFPKQGRALCRFWVPEATAEKRIEYQAWIAAGWLETTPGNVLDYEFVRAAINETAKIYKLLDLAYDPYNSSQLMIELAEQDGLTVTEFRQGFLSMNAPSKLLEKLVLQRAINHGDNPVLTWMASNAAIKEDPAGNIKPIKPQRTSSKKIDGIVALIMALGRSMVAEIPKQSVYKEREMIVL